MEEIVSFGKYKGQPLSVMLADKKYMEWLQTKDWFNEKFGKKYTVIQDVVHRDQPTPQHNRLQSQFVKTEYVGKFLSFVFRNRIEEFEELNILTKARQICDEVDKTIQIDDNTIRVTPGFDIIIPKLKLDTPCVKMFEPKWGSDVFLHSSTIGYDTTDLSYSSDAPQKYKKIVEAFWRSRIDIQTAVQVEIKPDFGDDYPCYIRQINKCRDVFRDINKMGQYVKNPIWVVLYERYTSVIDIEEVKMLLRNEGIYLIKNEDVLNAEIKVRIVN